MGDDLGIAVAVVGGGVSVVAVVGGGISVVAVGGGVCAGAVGCCGSVFRFSLSVCW